MYDDWSGRFYPKDLPRREWFGHYARHFDTVEVNNTFYRLPTADSVRKWAEQAPREFRYAVKASRFLTHFKHLNDPAEPLRLLFDRLTPLGVHAGPVLYQLPGNWHANVDRLDSFCGVLPAGYRHVFEFRHASWLTDAVFETLAYHGASLCVHDALDDDHPIRRTGPIGYVRLHGAQTANGCYTKANLRKWTRRVRELAAERAETFVYFNNDVGAAAVRNALTLRELLDA